MCTYNITVSDSLIEKARPAIGSDTDISQWMQNQIESLLIRMTLPQQNKYSSDMETILSMPLLDKEEVGLNGEEARMEYLKEKYDL